MTTSARVILDSLSPSGDRLTTMELEFHRFVLAEFNTHRSHSRNSASSRAIPLENNRGTGTLQRVINNPAWPLAWTSEKPGMQGGEPLTGKALNDAEMLFHDVWEFTVQRIGRYVDEHPDKEDRLHKSLVNRLMEPFMWHTVIATATDEGWANFFHLRATEFSPLAQPEIAKCADLALEAYRESIPEPLGIGEWHTPYIRADEEFDLVDRIKVSTARCARVSYLTHEGVRDPDEDVAMFERLTSAKPPHASPLEHVATPSPTGIQQAGNFKGWDQVRHLGLPNAL